MGALSKRFNPFELIKQVKRVGSLDQMTLAASRLITEITFSKRRTWVSETGGWVR